MSLEEIKDSISLDLLRHIAGQWNQRKRFDINDSTVQKIITVGNPAYDHILDICFNNEDPKYQMAAAYVLGIIGFPAIQQLEKGITHKNSDIRKEAITGLVNIGDEAIPTLGAALQISDKEIRRQVTHGLTRLGEVAENYLCEAITDEDDGVREIAALGLKKFDLPPLKPLATAVKDNNVRVATDALRGLSKLGDKGREAIHQAFEHEEDWIRETGANALFSIGINETSAPVIAMQLEDKSGRIVELVLEQLANRNRSVDTKAVRSAIIEELIIRSTGRSTRLFNPEITAGALANLTYINPNLHSQNLKILQEISFNEESDVRERAVLVARRLDKEDFASLVNANSENNPTAASETMRLLGGSESASFFSSQQIKALERYRTPLVELEKVGLDRWEGVTKQIQSSVTISIVMSVVLFLVGVAIMAYGLWLLTLSNDWVQQVVGGAGAFLSLISAITTRFWKLPVEHINRISSQQARLQAVFIGYMNQVAQIRTVFEQEYTENKISIKGLEKYQELMTEIKKQTFQQLEIIEGEEKKE